MNFFQFASALKQSKNSTLKQQKAGFNPFMLAKSNQNQQDSDSQALTQIEQPPIQPSTPIQMPINENISQTQTQTSALENPPQIKEQPSVIQNSPQIQTRTPHTISNENSSQEIEKQSTQETKIENHQENTQSENLQLLDKVRTELNEISQWSQSQSQFFDQLQQEAMIFNAEISHFLNQFEQ
ncbi:MAG: hypothetical protein Ta2E_11340 [Mycoplasmoidaceae bacterium]|nr:MAG: hypothetical protein Ta2E_11340 [Mycoplasmoidaceae bacterium]